MSTCGVSGCFNSGDELTPCCHERICEKHIDEFLIECDICDYSICKICYDHGYNDNDDSYCNICKRYLCVDHNTNENICNC